MGRSTSPALTTDNPWLAALTWAKDVFAKQQRLSQRPFAECPEVTLPKRLRPYLMTFDAEGKPTGIHADRYEFWLYRQIRKRFKSGELYLDDSLQHRCFTDELVSLDEKEDVLSQMDTPWLRRPIQAQPDALTAELRTLWLAFNRELRQGKLKHLDYDSETKALIWRKPKADNSATQQDSFYEQLSLCDVADVFRYVNGQCQFLSALTAATTLRQAGGRRRQPDGGDHRLRDEPRQPRYGEDKRHSLPHAGNDLPAVPAPGFAPGGQRPDQQRHRGITDLPALFVWPRRAVWCG